MFISRRLPAGWLVPAAMSSKSLSDRLGLNADSFYSGAGTAVGGGARRGSSRCVAAARFLYPGELHTYGQYRPARIHYASLCRLSGCGPCWWPPFCPPVDALYCCAWPPSVCLADLGVRPQPVHLSSCTRPGQGDGSQKCQKCLKVGGWMLIATEWLRGCVLRGCISSRVSARGLVMAACDLFKDLVARPCLLLSPTISQGGAVRGVL